MPSLRNAFCAVALILCIFQVELATAAEAPKVLYKAGIAQIDITPAYPIRLSGFGSRRAESIGVSQKIFASALAIGDNCLLVTVDNCGLPLEMHTEVARRLKAKRNLSESALNLCATHTHCAPMLTAVIPNLFSSPIAASEQATIDRYTVELTDKIEQVCLEAIDHKEPAELFFSQGNVSFAQNRRPQGGPTDHTLSVVAVKNTNGVVRGVFVNYACHCTTLGGDFNEIHGDWAGAVRAAIERDFPNAKALVSVGCGADSNPQPRGKMEDVNAHAEEVAAEVKRLLAGNQKPLTGPVTARAENTTLPFSPAPTREQWQERAQKPGIVGYHAQKNLARLDAGEKLPTSIPYPIHLITFGDALALILLPGEVVVDYVLALKKEFDPERLCVVAYANFDPCYIPSKRILNEGGYEAEESLWYYDRPARLAPEIEDIILGKVREMIPAKFKIDRRRAEFPSAKSPLDSMATIQTKPGFHVELAAAEPLIASPVAIDWGADGKLWVVEMRDFPMGMDGKWKPGGRVKFLEDTNHDGRYDRATIFLDNVPFPTGITAWREGVLVCAAPDILYAVDHDGDGHAEDVKRLFSGFATDNYQARVNSLSLGLDNWIYGANGLIGGTIKGARDGPEVSISGRDFRFNPNTLAFETASGLTQQGRVRDDFGNWFGCDNSTLIWHYPIEDRYLRRNPHVAGPDPRVNISRGEDPNRLHPISRTLQRFNDPGSANRATAVCGLGIYRDVAFGEEYYGNAFVCEPVHNLVRRMILKADGTSFAATQPPDELGCEFLAASDNWFRPVQARGGPDGALWIVDMYRFVVEHPRWITPERLAELDLRAGADQGRIYRVIRDRHKLSPITNLRDLSAVQLVEHLQSPNGTERDRVHLELLRRNDASIGPQLVSTLSTDTNSAVRAQILSVLDGLNSLTPNIILSSLADPSVAVAMQAIRLSEQPQFQTPAVRSALEKLDTSNPQIRLQLALSLGAWNPAWASQPLAKIAATQMDSYTEAALVSSSVHCAGELLKGLFEISNGIPKTGLIEKLVATALAENEAADTLNLLLNFAISPEAPSESKFVALAAILDSDVKLDSAQKKQIDAALQRARQTARETERPMPLRTTAVHLLARNRERTAAIEMLLPLLQSDASLAPTIADALLRIPSPQVARDLVGSWPAISPSLRRQIINGLVTRPDWIITMLDAVDQRVISASELSAPIRQRLSKEKDMTVRTRAAKLFAPANPARATVVAQYLAESNHTANLARGAIIFSNACATCHLFKGQGKSVGPNLAALTDKSPRFLITAILDPNAAVEDRYLNYTFELRDGRTLSGIVAEETSSSLTIVNASDVRESVLRTDIMRTDASNLSLMPEGFEQSISPAEMADLVGYLQ